MRRTLDYSEDSTQPVSANSSVCEGPSSPVQVEHPMEVEATHSQEVESLKRLLQEVCKMSHQLKMWTLIKCLECSKSFNLVKPFICFFM